MTEGFNALLTLLRSVTVIARESRGTLPTTVVAVFGSDNVGRVHYQMAYACDPPPPEFIEAAHFEVLGRQLDLRLATENAIGRWTAAA